jgi:acyl-coenzyme A synthetase/AMP-(fatty) acid ligase
MSFGGVEQHIHTKRADLSAQTYLSVLSNCFVDCSNWLIILSVATKVLLVANDISSRSMSVHIEGAQDARAAGELPQLRYTVVLEKIKRTNCRPGTRSYTNFLENGSGFSINKLRAAEKVVKDEDIVNVQFTSGTTGLPKAALLTHRFVLVTVSWIIHYLNCA